MTERDKARIQLWADYLNQTGVGTLLAGGATPIIEALTRGSLPDGFTLGVVLACVGAAIAAFGAAYDVLGRLEA